MSLTKRALVQADEDNVASVIAQYALEQELLDESQPAYGIARLLAEGNVGLLKLSPKQQAVYHDYIEPLGDVQCSACGEQIQPEELLFLSVNNGRCSHCQYRFEQMMKE